jgi:hypothetical protein
MAPAFHNQYSRWISYCKVPPGFKDRALQLLGHGIVEGGRRRRGDEDSDTDVPWTEHNFLDKAVLVFTLRIRDL